MEKRLTDLEVRYSYLERTVTELDGVILELKARVERLQKAVAEIRASELDEGLLAAPNEKPPHY
jgi:uncharacterized coiled-coil protein SlyX